jgi:uncharacterized membrane protein
MTLPRNVGAPERWLSILGGGAALAGGIRRRGFIGALLNLFGSYLLFRGFSGHCLLYRRLHIDTTRANDSGLWGQNLIHVQTRVNVQQPREVVYRHWRDLENLPAFMRHIRSIRVDGNRSHWVARAPLGLRLRWDSQITQDSPNERLTWRSVADSQVDSRGEVRFRPIVNGGTEVDVDMYYRPPGGTMARALARVLGGISERMVQQDIERFRDFVESQAAGGQPQIDYDQGLGREPRTPAHG